MAPELAASWLGVSWIPMADVCSRVAVRVLVAVAAGLLLLGCTPGQREPMGTPTPRPAAGALRIACPAAGSAEAQYCLAVREVVARALPALDVTATTSGEAREHLQRIARGEVDLGQHRQDLAYLAYRGEGYWRGQPDAQVRVLWLYDFRPLVLVVRADSGIASVRQLDGQSFAAGFRGSEAGSLARDLLDDLGIRPRYYDGGLEDVITALREGRIVGFAKTQRLFNRPDPLISRMHALTPLRLLSFDDDERGRLQRARPEVTWAGLPSEIDPAAENRAPLVSPGFAHGFATSARLPAETAYLVARAVDADNRPQAGGGYQASAYPEVKGTDLAALSVAVAHTPLHAGALRYYRELGLVVAPAAIPPEAP